MEYISAKEATDRWELTGRMVIYHCINGPINGTQKIGEYVADLTNGKTDLRNNK